MDKKKELRTQIEKERDYLNQLVREGAKEEQVVSQSRRGGSADRPVLWQMIRNRNHQNTGRESRENGDPSTLGKTE